ncbi:MAG: hypothetical protein Q4A64_03865 [Porphyromonadaceae bacterium]|nr:hypothetical protein [Porphyromonadaceae bacterium]
MYVSPLEIGAVCLADMTFLPLHPNIVEGLWLDDLDQADLLQA